MHLGFELSSAAVELGFFSSLFGWEIPFSHILFIFYLQSEVFSWIKVLTMCSEQIPHNDKLILFTCIFPEFTDPVNIDKALV